MLYKTISFKLRRPTSKKSAIIDDALIRYSDAFEYLLRELRPLSGKNPSGMKVGFLKLINKDIMGLLNPYGVEPFKDALKFDVASLLSSYLGRKKGGMKASYPISRTDDEDIEEILTGDRCRRANLFFNKYRALRPIMFCRYSKGRDYSLLKSDSGSGFYVKIYLLNKANAIESPKISVSDLRYIGLDSAVLKTQNRPVRYLLLPIVPADWQLSHLQDVELGRAKPKSAALFKQNGDYYLNVCFSYENAVPEKSKNFLGIARGLENELYYAAASPNGDIFSKGSINVREDSGINKLHKLANKIVDTAKENKCQIVMYNLTGRNDWLKFRSENTGSEGDFIPVGPGDYNKLVAFVEYKALACGLEAPMIVSPRGVYHRCPACDTFKAANRMNRNTFLCVRCGYSGGLEQVGAINLARRIIQYRENKIQILYKKVGKRIYFESKPLGLYFACDDTPFAKDLCINRVMKILKEPEEFGDSTKRNVVLKLSDAPLSNSIVFIEDER